MNINKNVISLIKRNDKKFKKISFFQDEILKKEFFTSVMLYEAKYIDKNRVISKLGKSSPQFFNKIYNKLFGQIFEPIYYKMQKMKNNQ